MRRVALSLKIKDIISWNYLEKQQNLLEPQKLLPIIFLLKYESNIAKENMKTEFINLIVNCRVITDDHESFNDYFANTAKYRETRHEKPTIKVDLFITISIKTTFKSNFNFRRIRSSIDTNVIFAYDYVAIKMFVWISNFQTTRCGGKDIPRDSLQNLG